MTNEEIAESCGWKLSSECDRFGNRFYTRGNEFRRAGEYPKTHDPLPDFLNDLNACAQFEATLELGHDGSQWDDYQQTLWGIVNPGIDFNSDNLHDVAYLKNLISATAAQRCEAFLETIRE